MQQKLESSTKCILFALSMLQLFLKLSYGFCLIKLKRYFLLPLTLSTAAGVCHMESEVHCILYFQGVCPHCGVFYGNLGQHVGLYCPKNPNRQRAYHCCYCKYRSVDRATLIEHKASHVLARDFKCEICDSSFFTRQRLVRHMRYVHLLGTNPVRIYTCDRCGKRFRYHSHYDRHLTIHSGTFCEIARRARIVFVSGKVNSLLSCSLSGICTATFLYYFVVSPNNTAAVSRT